MFAHKDMFRSKNESEWLYFFLPALQCHAGSLMPHYILMGFRISVAENTHFIVRHKMLPGYRIEHTQYSELCVCYMKKAHMKNSLVSKYPTNLKSGSLPIYIRSLFLALASALHCLLFKKRRRLLLQGLQLQINAIKINL